MSRVLNMADRVAGLPGLIVCPRCDGQAYDRDSCHLCGNFGYLLEDGAGRLQVADAMQIAARFTIVLGLELCLKRRAGGRDE